MKNLATNLLLAAVSIFVSLVLAEVAAQVYVYQIAQKGKLFETSHLTGWRVKPNLELERANSNGDPWTITTDDQGFRRMDPWDDSKRRVLILGDSFAFGEGVDIQDRFDRYLVDSGLSVLNTGVMGFGPDQQFLIARPYLDQLKKAML